MGRKEDNIKKAQTLLHQKERIRNIGTAAHIDHGKTTLSDSLIAGAGMISEELAGSQLFMDFDEQEQARGITINAAIASMVHDFEGGQFLINLIDTPGHVDFGGDVTRAMRAIDGVIILDDAVEGIMPQTETVIRQALKERVRPVLFINKVDRLVNELKISPDQMQQRFQKIIGVVNDRIRKFLPEDLGAKWPVNVEAGSVAFGSAYHKWALSVPYMKRTGITFKDVYKHCQEGTMKELAKKAPLHNVVLNMVIRHLPNPLEAQKTRIPVIWKGDLESPIGKAMMTVDENGPVGFMVTKIIVDPQAGEVAAGRLFAGKIRRGQELWVVGMPKPQRAQTVAMIVGPDRIPVDEIDAGNVVAVVGLKDAIAGSTVSDDKDMQTFEKIVHYSDPVVTIAVEAKSTSDLPKLVEALRLLESGPQHPSRDQSGDGRASHLRDGRTPPRDHDLPGAERLQDPGDDESADRRVPRGRRRRRRSLRRQVPQQAQPLLHGGRAPRGEDRPGDSRGRDRIGPANQGLEGAREEARRARHGPQRGEERRLDPRHEYANRCNEGDSISPRDDGANQGSVHGSDGQRAARRGEEHGREGPTRRREAP